MALMTRVARLFRADVHAVLDRLEEPDVLLRQAIREMEESLAADREQARRLARELEATRGRVEETGRALGLIEKYRERSVKMARVSCSSRSA